MKHANVLWNRKFGFLYSGSTVSQLLLDKSIDFMKAFDTVPNQQLLRVLRCYNTPEKLDNFEDFLRERKQSVTADNVFSNGIV